MSKDEILNNIENLTAQQICEYIYQGIVTFDELKKTGDFDKSKQDAVKSLQIEIDTKRDALLTELNKADDDAWNRVNVQNIKSIQNYIDNFSNGKHIIEANNAIRYLIDAIKRAEKDRVEVLENLRIDPNIYSPDQILNYINNDTISKQDLLDCGIPQHIINMLGNIYVRELHLGDTPTTIPNGYTEVYFWGSPGSGKTCALAAVLNAAESKRNLQIAESPGYKYTHQLKNTFKSQNTILPPPTNVEKNQYLPIAIKERSISLIELSGEIFQCFHLIKTGDALSDSHKESYNSLLKFLGTDNRKIHFFFIDFTKKDIPDKYDATQSDYLLAASNFFVQHNIFNKKTDAIYIVITKSDMMPNCNDYEQKVKYAVKHIETDGALNNFKEIIKKQCELNHINAKKLFVEPFTLGKVYFQKICDFNDETALKIVDILIDRIPVDEKGGFFKFFNKLNK